MTQNNLQRFITVMIYKVQADEKKYIVTTVTTPYKFYG